ncbi:MAG: hypothetical protein N2B06_01820 [Clostridium sp.]
MNAFIIGSLSSVGTIFYITRAYKSSTYNEPTFLPIIIPMVVIITGIFNIVNASNILHPILIGLIVAFLFSSYGIYIGLPEKIFNVTHSQARLFASMYYPLLFIILSIINKNIII